MKPADDDAAAGRTPGRSPAGPHPLGGPADAPVGRGVQLDPIFEQLFDASPDGILLVDAAGRIIQANARAEAMFGYGADELDGVPIDALVPPRYRPVHGQHRAHYTADPQSRPMGVGLNLSAVRADGGEFPVEVGLAPLAGRGGERLVAAYVRDISPTARGQASFKRARFQEYQRLLSQEALTAVDVEQIVQRTPSLLAEALDCEESAILLLAESRRELYFRAWYRAGQNFDPATAPRQPNRRDWPAGRVVHDDAPVVVDDIGSDPRFGPAAAAPLFAGVRSVVLVPLHGEGHVIGVLAARSFGVRRFAHEDLSFVISIGNLLSVAFERQRHQQRLAQGQKMEALGQLTGGVAHDFNNILTVVLGNLQLLDDLLAERPVERKLAAAASKAASRGADLTRKLLAFARRQPLQPRPVAVGPFVAGLVDLLQRTLGEGVELVTAVAEPALQFYADPGLLETAMLNLAVNARDAMPAGGRLTISAEPAHVGAGEVNELRELTPGEYVRISVTDTGEGIDPAHRARIFEPFFTTKGAGGSGLGLAMVYGFVKQTGGGIAVYSEPGQGTSFKVYLPRAAKVEAERPAAAARTAGGRERILVVEDDPEVRSLALRFLRSLGYVVLAVGDAPAALERLARGPRVDLLFSDIVLPGGLSGVDLARQALERQAGLKVLLTSGYPRDALPTAAQAIGEIELLSKPYSRDDLARELRRVLDGRAAPA